MTVWQYIFSFVSFSGLTLNKMNESTLSCFDNHPTCKTIFSNILLNEAEEDMNNSADQGGSYPQRPKAEVDNTLQALQNSSYPTNAELIIALLLI